MGRAHFNKGSISITAEEDWEVEIMRKWVGRSFKASHITKDLPDLGVRIYLVLMELD